MEAIQKLDQKLTCIFKGFDKQAQALAFQVICELNNEHVIAQQKYPGLYRIDIRSTEPYRDFAEWVSWFNSEWVRDEYERKHTPNPKKKRIAAHSELKEWVPLYLGKSRDIASRVWEHINLKLEQPTTAMKLKERVNLAGHRFRLSTLRVDVDNYDLIMPKLESAFRDIYNPILGRQ